MASLSRSRVLRVGVVSFNKEASDSMLSASLAVEIVSLDVSMEISIRSGGLKEFIVFVGRFGPKLVGSQKQEELGSVCTSWTWPTVSSTQFGNPVLIQPPEQKVPTGDMPPCSSACHSNEDPLLSLVAKRTGTQRLSAEPGLCIPYKVVR